MGQVVGVIPGAAPQLLMAEGGLADASAALPSARPVPVGDGIGAVLAEPGSPAPPGLAWRAARAALPALPPQDQPVALRAVAVANWRSQGRFCPACGGPVEPDWPRQGFICAREGRPVFPRTDPCVITAILDRDDRLLLSHASNHQAGVYTLVAGFVEAGEPLEAAVRREAFEEVGLELAGARFIRSQAWPFPGSLMASFAALAATTEISVDGDEILDAAWFTRPQLARALDSGRVTLPMDYSVARQTIEAWRSGALAW
ncbi:MAG: NAD(+) diphosphatase [Bifidobacteriaceae bacterium]|nr:NAD(+) diphosphatase [Bifidobacteriaceae bacterium]